MRRKSKFVTGIAALGIAATLATAAKAEEPASPPVTQTADCKVVGSFYGEAGVYGQGIQGNVWLGNLNLGYNLLNRSADSTLLLNARVSGAGDELNPYNDRMEYGLGLRWNQGNLAVGIEAVRREPRNDLLPAGTYGRAYLAHWAMASARPLTQSPKAPMRFWGTSYLEAEYNTFKDIPGSNGNAIGSWTGTGNLNFLNAGPVAFNMYGSGKVQADIKNRPWNRYWNVEGGLAADIERVRIMAGVGRREPFDNTGFSGNYAVARVGVFLPIRFCRNSIP